MGILSYLRDIGRPWLGRALAKPSGADRELRRDKLKTSRPNQSFKVLPYLDPTAQETEANRRLYRTMLKDAVVRPAFYSKVMAVATLDMAMTPDDPENPIDTMVSDFCKYTVSRINGGIVGLAEELLPPLLVDGYVLGEKVRRPLQRGKYAGKWTITEVRPKHPDLYDIRVDEQGRPTHVEGRGIAHGDDYPVSEFVVGRFLPLYGNPMGTSDLAAAYQAYWRRDTAWKLRHMRLKNVNSPYLVAKYTEAHHQSILIEACETAQSGGFAVVPDSVVMEVLNLATSNNSEFREAIQDLDQEILRCLTGATLQMSEGNRVGSFAQSKVHQGGADLLVWHLADVFARLINTEIIPDLCDLNYAGYSDYPQSSFGGVSDEALAASLAIDEGLTRVGFVHSKKDLASRYRRTWAVNEEDAVKPAPPPPPPPASGPGGLPPMAFSEMKVPVLEFAPAPEVPATRPFDVASFSEADELSALPGKEGAAAEALIAACQKDGVKTLAAICREAFARLGVHRPSFRFTTDERQRLADSLAATLATAHLLGQARLRRQLAKVTKARKVKSLEFAESHKFASTQFNVDQMGYSRSHGSPIAALQSMVDSIDDDDLAADGRESEFHVTVKYGLHTANADDVRDVVKGFGPISIVLGETTLFPAKDANGFDVVKIDVISPEIEALNRLLSDSLPNTKTHPVYHAHLTLAYVKPGAGGKYAGPNALTGQQLDAWRLVFSDQSGEKTVIDISEPAKITTFADLEPIRPLPPEKALEYFRGLIPDISGNPAVFGPLMTRRAFTLAVATEEALLTRVQEVIANSLATGEGGTYDVQKLLDAAGVSPRNPQYAEAVYRTNMMTSYQQGYEAERMDPDVIEEFPVWEWMTIVDGRERERHHELAGKIFPATVSFQEVQGTEAGDVINCRCASRAIGVDEWDRMQKAGRKAEESW